MIDHVDVVAFDQAIRIRLSPVRIGRKAVKGVYTLNEPDEDDKDDAGNVEQAPDDEYDDGIPF